MTVYYWRVQMQWRRVGLCQLLVCNVQSLLMISIFPLRFTCLSYDERVDSLFACAMFILSYFIVPHCAILLSFWHVVRFPVLVFPRLKRLLVLSIYFLFVLYILYNINIGTLGLLSACVMFSTCHIARIVCLHFHLRLQLQNMSVDTDFGLISPCFLVPHASTPP